MQGLAGASGAMTRGVGQGVNTLVGAAQGFNPYIRGGQGAANQQAAFTGALGGNAQQQAYANYNESPATQYMREQGERGVMRNSAAMGGLGGGNVMKELGRFNQGLAQQDFGNHFNRLGQVAQGGMQGLGQQAQLGSQAAGMQQGLGNALGGLRAATGSQMSQNRMQTGRDFANQIGNTTNNVSDLQLSQGQGLSDLLSQYGVNLSNSLSGGAGMQGDNLNNLMSLLGQYGMNAGANASGIGANATNGIGNTFENGSLLAEAGGQIFRTLAGFMPQGKPAGGA